MPSLFSVKTALLSALLFQGSFSRAAGPNGRKFSVGDIDDLVEDGLDSPLNESALGGLPNGEDLGDLLDDAGGNTDNPPSILSQLSQLGQEGLASLFKRDDLVQGDDEDDAGVVAAGARGGNTRGNSTKNNSNNNGTRNGRTRNGRNRNSRNRNGRNRNGRNRNGRNRNGRTRNGRTRNGRNRNGRNRNGNNRNNNNRNNNQNNNATSLAV